MMNDNSPDATSILGTALGSPDQPVPQTAPVGTGGALTQAGPAAATVAPQPAPQQAAQDGWSDMNEAAAAQPTSRLHSILAAVAGAVGNGLAAGAGQRGRQSFGSGVQAGAKAQLEYEFQSAADAARARDFTLREKELQNQSQEYQDKHDEFQQKLADYNKANNGTTYTYVPNDNGGASVLANFKGQMATQGNIQVPAGTIPMSHGWLIPNDASSDTKNYNTFGPFFGLTPSKGQVPPAATTQLNYLLSGRLPSGELMSPDQLTQQAANLKQQLADYSARPNADPRVAGVIQATITHLNNTRDEIVAGKANATKSDTQAKLDAENSPQNVQAAANKAAMVAAAEAKARLPYDLAKTRADQAVKDGDPRAAAQLLVNGDVAPSQLVSSRQPAFAQQAFTEAKKLNPNWNSQQAEGYFKAASAPSNVTFYGSANSLLDKGGTLDQMRSAYDALPNGQIPAINGAINWADKTIGGKAPSGFAATALGLADDYSKVMTGGQGSDTSRNAIMKTLTSSSSPAQMQQTLTSMRNALLSQVNGRIGTNPVAKRMYGYNVPPPPQQGEKPVQDKAGRTIGYTTDGKTMRPI